ncbi:MAG: family 78 glycoside hydrolase catalytic domain [Saprospiraceae bacterium]|nr:family 78 glycoside hydrolase catalytic domain [Saprospiraceae bacterium]
MRNKISYIGLFKVIFLLLLFISCNTENGIEKPFDLSVSEGFTNPIGFYDDNPTFSWKLPLGVQEQGAYSIAVASTPDLLSENADLWESGRVDSDQSVYVKYKGPKLVSRQKVYWQVKYWDSNGNESKWSDEAHFELGLLDNADWNSKWINHPDIKLDSVPEIDRKIHKVQYFRKDFELGNKIQSARLYISAKGLYEAEINGKKIGNDVLAPGWTPYEKRIETLTYDVGELLKEGDNTIGLVLAEGWHSGRLLFRNYSGKIPQITAQLEVTYNDGKQSTIVTDNSWKGSMDGPIQFSSLYDGELYDANLEMPNWSTTDYADEDWAGVDETPLSPEVKLRPKSHAPVITKLTLSPITISEPKKGSFVFDLGQNMAGVPRINIPVKKGQKVKIRVAEMLQTNGEIYIDNYRGALSTDYYTPAEDGTISWQPTFTFHGFRYVELSGFDESKKPEKDWISGLVQHSDFEISGNFSSSHEKLNQLQSNIEWGLRGNFLDIPTDCPQRNERLGWTGDAQVFGPTSLFNADVHAFWSSWMKSVREDQNEDGGIPFYVPKLDRGRSSSGWGDAITVIPWDLYQRTGDTKVLEDNYEAMNKWLDYYQSKATDHIVKMFTFGDWLQPYSENPENTKKGETDERLLSTAYYARSIEITRQAAEVLGLQEDEAKLKDLSNEVRKAFQNEFFNDDGSIKVGRPTQTGYLMALGFDLISEDLAEKAVPYLLAEIEKADNHLRTGFLGTPLLAPVLDEIGRSDLMFQILFKETYPSWFYSINQGATTMWERWDSYSHSDGFHKEGMNSFNHYAYGAIGQWMYERIAGIKASTAGYKTILINPLPGGPLTSATAEYQSPYGLIKSAWKIVDDKFIINAAVPPNTTAKIIIPANTGEELLLEGITFSENSNVKLIEKSENAFELQLEPGSYEFTSKIN